MTADRIFTSRLARLPLLAGDGQPIGRVADVLILPTGSDEAPRVLGFVAEVQRRQIFVNINRVAEMATDGVHLRGGTVDLGRFNSRPEEMLVSQLYNRRTADGLTVMDVAIAPSIHRSRGWEVAALALGTSRTLRRQVTHVASWEEHPELFETGPVAKQLASLREMNPTDLANVVEGMSAARRRLLAEAMDDEELADVLEEMSEQDQLRLLADLDLERIADVVEEMEPDDAADLLAEMPVGQREVLLSAMDPEEAAEVRRLLRYDATTAGGLMTSQPIVVAPDVPVAEVLARVRDPEVTPASGASVYVCEPPTATPTGRYLGVVGFQRLLREAPAVPVGECVEESGFIRPELPESQVAERMAAYNLVGLAVCDDAGRLVGAVTVDDVLDRLLPVGWRRRR
ncbi:MAG: magnesium transporter MgtE N-terminal domain-containing protein [Acidimicrobiales bacterium]